MISDSINKNNNKKPNYCYFPKEKSMTFGLKRVVVVFKKEYLNINSELNTSLKSNQVLGIVRERLEGIGFNVEKSKKDIDKVFVSKLPEGSVDFRVDAYNKNTKVLIEVEAGRAVENYQFLKDLFEAFILDVDYLVIAVKNKYKKNDFDKVCKLLAMLYKSKKFNMPLEGILIIGY